MNIFDGMICASPTNPSTSKATSIDELIALKNKFDAEFPPVTAEQKLWAQLNGFPGFPGFKLGRIAYARLRWMAQIKTPLYQPPDPLGYLYGVPVVMDESLPEHAVMSAEQMWNLKQQALKCKNS